MTCDKCGQPLEIGMHPWCPHGFPAGNSRALVDEWPSGKTFENGFESPRTFYSRSEYTKALAANGLKVQGSGEEHFDALGVDGLRKAEELVRRVHSDKVIVAHASDADRLHVWDATSERRVHAD